ncbi:efflux RND transporter permease subunit [Devriesea agamarum]|uniref:efflux RND transporter permease subunit n=1 Tax=Devriesea agamarum TaxID=472569 RepID=UPI00071C4D3C|nr:efflux RND transporter permease subunit [Devriesea agamarum]
MKLLANVSLKNRSFIALVCVVVSILGAYAMTTLRQELIPSLDLPQIRIVTSQSGASAEQIEQKISAPIEQAVRGLENVDSTSSTSRSGVSMVTVELTYGTDVARSANKVDAAIGRLKDRLPEGVDPQVIAGGASEIPALVTAVSSDSDQGQLADRLRTTVVPALEKLDGVSSVVLAGAPTKIVRVIPQQEKLTASGLTVSDVENAIKNAGSSLPGGTVTRGNQALDVTIGKDFSSLDQLRTLMVTPSAPAATPPPKAGRAQTLSRNTVQRKPVQLSSVASVEHVEKDATSISRTNGRESLVLVVTAEANGNVVDVSKEVSQKLDDLLPTVGGNAHSDVVFDQAPFIRQSIDSLATEGLLGLGFAIVVILLFLLSVRSTLVTAISIPLSVLMAFLGMLVFGYTLNMLTLAALTISIGRVVDDSIVVIENIKRHLTYGEPKMQAVVAAVKEVAGAVTSSTLATVIVFLPIAVVTGMAGELFRPFSLTVAIAMLSSLFVSLTIVPVLAFWFLKGNYGKDPRETAAIRDRAEQREERSILHRLYSPVLRVTQAHRIVTILVSIAIVVGTGFLFPLMTLNFLGDSGQNLASFSQTLPNGTSLKESSEKAAEAEKALLGIDGVTTVQTTIGAGQFSTGGQPNEITYAITTKDDADQEALRHRIDDTLKSLPDHGDISMQASGGPGGASTVNIDITGPTATARRDANDLIMDQLANPPASVSQVTSDLTADQPAVVISVKSKEAAARGLTESAIVGLVAQELNPSSIGKVSLDGTDTDIYVAGDTKPVTLNDLTKLSIAGVPLTDLATIEERNVVPELSTKNTQATVTIALTPAGQDVGAVMKVAQDSIDAVKLPDGARASVGGAADDISQTFGQIGIAILAAILLVYVLLVWIFKSLVQPLILLVSIPFAATGAFGLLVLTNTPLGLPSMIGLLMLIGIVVTNAIVLVDLVNQYRRDGMPLDEAIRSGARRRLRPILMTAAATIFALLPMALGITGYSAFISKPLAVVVIGGLVSSTLLTLVLVPVLYRMVEGPGEKRRLRREAEQAERDRRATRERHEQAGASFVARPGNATARPGNATKRPVNVTGRPASAFTDFAATSARGTATGQGGVAVQSGATGRGGASSRNAVTGRHAALSRDVVMSGRDAMPGGGAVSGRDAASGRDAGSGRHAVPGRRAAMGAAVHASSGTATAGSANTSIRSANTSVRPANSSMGSATAPMRSATAPMRSATAPMRSATAPGHSANYAARPVNGPVRSAKGQVPRSRGARAANAVLETVRRRGKELKERGGIVGIIAERRQRGKSKRGRTSR